MKKIINSLAVVMFFSSLVGCSLAPEPVLPKLAVNKNVENMGHKKAVAIKITNEMKGKSIGSRGANVPGISVPIMLANGSADTIYDAVASSLKAKGFMLINYSANAKRGTVLSIRVTNLTFEFIPPLIGSGPGSRLLTSSMEVNATNNGLHYVKEYNVNYEGSNDIFAETKSYDQELVSKVLSKNINRILVDKSLIEFLAR